MTYKQFRALHAKINRMVLPSCQMKLGFNWFASRRIVVLAFSNISLIMHLYWDGKRWNIVP